MSKFKAGDIVKCKRGGHNVCDKAAPPLLEGKDYTVSGVAGGDVFFDFTDDTPWCESRFVLVESGPPPAKDLAAELAQARAEVEKAQQRVAELEQQKADFFNEQHTSLYDSPLTEDLAKLVSPSFLKRFPEHQGKLWASPYLRDLLAEVLVHAREAGFKVEVSK